MKHPDFDQNQLLNLIASVLEGDLDDAARESLNRLLKDSSAARRFYRQHMELHTRLHLDYAGSGALQHMPGVASKTSKHRGSRVFSRVLALAAVAACLALLAVIVWPRQPQPTGFATLTETLNTQWENGDLPTSPGSRLGQGTLRLAEGLVTIRFDSGAELNLEAPAELTLVDKMHCTLANGIVVANVPESAKGFRIETHTANVIDYGTRFSVISEPLTGRTHTKVFEGNVEVENPKSGEKVSLKKGQSNTITADGRMNAVTGIGSAAWPASIGPKTRGPEWMLLGTDKDAYIGRAFEHHTEVHRSEALLLVKNGDVHRKVFLGFDLADIDARRVTDAELMLNFEPTGWGLASLVPDSTFSVYGLLADVPWQEDSLTEENAPANTWRSKGRMRASDGDPKLVAAEVRKLGSFLIKQGVQQGPFGIRGESLAEFLRERAGGEITLIVVRDTIETETNGLVHGFASRRHPILRPPTLAIRLGHP